jgi:hypothetical protein
VRDRDRAASDTPFGFLLPIFKSTEFTTFHCHRHLFGRIGNLLQTKSRRFLNNGRARASRAAPAVRGRSC